MTVIFTRAYSTYNAGDTATFTAETEASLVTQGIAKMQGTSAPPNAPFDASESLTEITYYRNAIATIGGFVNSTTVDVNARFGVKPGDDVTNIIQYLLNALQPGSNLDIVFSVSGIYYVNGAPQAGTATVSGFATNGSPLTLSYTYSGSILLPAVAWDGGLPSTVVRIRGMAKIAYGDTANGDSGQGVTLATTQNVAGNYMFAAVPASVKYDHAFTGIMAYFEDITFSHPQNPQGGSVNIETCLRGSIKGVVCKQGALNSSIFPTGTAEAIILPQTYSNGFVMVRDVQIRGWGAGIRLSEHAVLDNVDISYTAAAFTTISGGHANWFGYVDVEECPVVFDMRGPAGTVLIVTGSLDVENVSAGTSFAPTSLVKFANASQGLLGNLDLTTIPNGSLGIIGRGSCQMQLNNATFARKNLHPIDTMKRMNSLALPSGTGPGLTWPTLDAWQALSGNFAVSTAGEVTSAGNASAYLPARDGQTGGWSRRVAATFVVPASSYDVSLAANRQQTGTLAAWARLSGGGITFGIGSLPGGGLIKTFSGVITGAGTYKVALDVFLVGGVMVRVDVYLNGTLLYSHACSAAQQIVPAGTDPFLMDGVYYVDAVTKMTAFSVTPSEAPPASLSSGLAVLVAGSATVAYPNVTAASVVRLNRQAAGGTLGQLSVSVTAGTGFTINSSSTTDTSGVYWEIVSL